MQLTKYEIFLAAIAATASLNLACSTSPKEAKEDAVLSKTSQAAAKVGAKHYAVINFETGQTALSEAEKEKLRALTSTARQYGEIDEIQVLAWADQEYPVEGQKAPSRDEKLADQRASTIKDYLKENLHTSADVDSHNMAKRPGVLSELLKTEDFEVKTSFENTGAAPNERDSRSVLTGDKASKAVVLVKYE